MKKVLLAMVITFILVLSDIAFSSVSVSDNNINIAEAIEEENMIEQPSIYYDTFFEDLNPKQLLEFNNSIYVATDKTIYEYKKEEGIWSNFHVEAPTDFTMGTLKALEYCEVKDGFLIKNYNKIVIDINNDGKEVYELEKTTEENYKWIKIIENGKFCKEVTFNADEYKIINFYNERVEENKVRIDNSEFYFMDNELYVKEDGKEPELIKNYGEAGNVNLKIIQFGKELFIFGGTFGVECITKSESYKGNIYSSYSIGEFNSSANESIVDMASVDNGHTLFVLSKENKIYKVIMTNTWVQYNNEIEGKNYIQCNVNEENKIKEITIDNKIFKIVTNDQYEKSFITINGKVLHQTIRDSFQYPDEILSFNGKDDYLYFWSNVSQPIRVNIKEETVEFMGQSNLFKDNVNSNRRLVKDSEGRIYLINSDNKVYRYIEKNKFYDSELPVKASDIKIFNGSCYAISEAGLYRFNATGKWECVVNGDINDNYEEELIILGSNLYALSNGSLYKLSQDNKWGIIQNKINSGLKPIYFVNENEKKVYFVSEEKNEGYVTIIDYGQKQWSKTKALPEIKNINSLAGEGNNIYIGTEYVSNGTVYVYKNGKWNEILPQLNIKITGTTKNSKLIQQNNEIYFETSDSGKEGFGVWKLKNGEVSRVEDIKEQDAVLKKLKEDNSLLINEIGVAYTLKDGKVLRKIN